MKSSMDHRWLACRALEPTRAHQSACRQDGRVGIPDGLGIGPLQLSLADRCPAGHGIALQIQSSFCGIPSGNQSFAIPDWQTCLFEYTIKGVEVVLQLLFSEHSLRPRHFRDCLKGALHACFEALVSSAWWLHAFSWTTPKTTRPISKRPIPTIELR